MTMKSTLYIILFFTFIFTLQCGCQFNTPKSITGFNKIHTWSPRTLYRDFYTWPKLSPDASKIAFIKEGQLMKIDIPFTKEQDISSVYGYSRVSSFSWQKNGKRLAINGYSGNQRMVKYVYFDSDSTKYIPNNARSAVWSKDGDKIAYYLNTGSQKGIWISDHDFSDSVLVIPDIYPRSMTFSNNGTLLAVMTRDDGVSNKLILYNIEFKRRTLLLDSLDAESPIYFTEDDNSLLLSLASAQSFQPENIHKAIADRDLDIYEINILNKSIEKIFASAADDIIVGIDGDKLYWTQIEPSLSIGIIPCNGGDLITVIPENSYNPSWHPGGKIISATYGQFRLMDFPLNWDIASVELDEKMHPKGNVYLEASGYHEDMAPMWSPSGEMVAYHGHRSSIPVSSYRADGSTDGIWVKDVKKNEEFLLVNPGHETGICDWSPSGDRILFTTVLENEDQHKPYWVYFNENNETTDSIIPVPIEGIEGDIIHVNWSPVGNVIALEEDLGGFNRIVWTIDLDDNTKQKVVEYVCFARWGGLGFSPDGRHIYYSALANEHHQIFKISLDDQQISQITNFNKELFHPQISPDGSYIACSVIKHQKDIWSAVLK